LWQGFLTVNSLPGTKMKQKQMIEIEKISYLPLFAIFYWSFFIGHL